MAIVKTNSQHYADIASAIRAKNGGSDQYTPQQMPGAILGLEAGSLKSAIIVTAPAGSQITLACGDVVRTAPENEGVWRFDNCDLGVWTVTASKDGMSRTYTVTIEEKNQMMRYEVQVMYARLYGIKRDIASASPLWTRTENAAGFTAAASVGTVAGHSDFDSCYPWSEMKRETFSTGDVMVKIPKFWYKRYQEGTVEHLIIADGEVQGYKLHPAFCHGGIQRDAIYVGAYKLSEAGTTVSGVLPKVSTSRSSFRTLVRSKGTGWGMVDVSTRSALQMLYLVEFANYGSQAMIGKGLTSYSSNNGRMQMGTTGAVPNLTGSPAGTEGQVDMVWRGMEGLWGNVLEFVDGLNFDCGNHLYYVCNDPACYADDVTANYDCLSFSMPTMSSSGSYITKLGLDPANDHIMLAETASGGSSSTYICDTQSCSSFAVFTVAKMGGRWISKEKAGIFKIEGTGSSGDGFTNTGIRAIYIPQEVSA